MRRQGNAAPDPASSTARGSRLETGKATSRDVARAANVSQTLVSRAFTGNGKIAAPTRKRIFEVAAELGWQPNALARSMVTGDAPLVAVITTGLQFDWRAQVLSRLLKAIQDWHLKPLLFYAENDEDVDQLLKDTLSWRARGVIVTAGVVRKQRASAILERGQFLAALNRPVNHRDGFSVATDNRYGGRTAAKLFLDQGRHKLLVLGGPSDGWATCLRTSGFVEAVSPERGQLNVWNNNSMTVEAGSACARRLLDLPACSRPDAVFATNDAMALGFLDGIRGALEVPRELALIGFDNLSASSWAPYQLTTFEQPLDKMVALVKAYIDRHQKGEPGHLPATLRPDNTRNSDGIVYCAPDLIMRSSMRAPNE